jgi:hypothetical protein
MRPAAGREFVRGQIAPRGESTMTVMDTAPDSLADAASVMVLTRRIDIPLLWSVQEQTLGLR